MDWVVFVLVHVLVLVLVLVLIKSVPQTPPIIARLGGEGGGGAASGQEEPPPAGRQDRQVWRAGQQSNSPESFSSSFCLLHLLVP